MIDLKCKCTNCHFNHYCNCEADKILVTNGTSCDSFKLKHGSHVEFADEILEPLVRHSTDVECHAKCVFNHDNTCVANGITVSPHGTYAECESFLRE